ALYKLGENDEVLTTLMEHHSNIVPWEILSKIKGFRVKYVDIKDDGTLDYDNLEDLVTQKTRLITVTHASNVTGAINDISKIAKLAHENNAILVVDGAQSVPHMPVDVRRLDIDFLAFSGHKMLAPTGIGVLYARKELLENMEPFIGGGDMIKSVRYDRIKGCMIEWHTLPWKFEAGTPNVCSAIGLAEAIRYLRRLGMENVKEHEHQLTKYTLKLLQEDDSISVYGPKDTSIRCGIVSFNIKNIDHHDVALLLDNEGIMVRSGYHCAEPLHQRLGLSGSVRASFYMYNTKEEVERFVQVLKEIENVR
ncbi:MAG: cysteine desulfurase, partial [Nitrososphaeria archaeon]